MNHKNQEVIIDDGFGALEELIPARNNIEEQIKQYFGEQDHYVTILQNIAQETYPQDWERVYRENPMFMGENIDLLYENYLQHDTSLEELILQYQAEEINEYQSTMNQKDQVVNLLHSMNLPLSGEWVKAAVLNQNQQDPLLKRLALMRAEEDETKNLLDDMENPEQLQNNLEGIYHRAEEMLKNLAQHTDSINEMKNICNLQKEIHLNRKLNESHHYEIAY